MLPPIDFETYSSAGYVWDDVAQRWRGPPGAPGTQRGLSVTGAAAYARHPSTEVLSLSYANGHHWRPGLPRPDALLAYVERGGLLEAHGSAFEYWIWNEVCVPRYGWPPLPIEQLRCTMARARAHALPGQLALLGDVLALQVRKDKDGTRLLQKFSVPRNPTKHDPRLRLLPEDDPVDGPRLYGYNHTDCASEHEAGTRMPELSPAELTHWLNDQRINRRGVAIDEAGVAACCAIVEAAVQRYDGELVALTDGIRSTELQKLIGWLHCRGVHTDSLDADSVADLLKLSEPGTPVHRALTIRAAVGSASVKKVFAMRLQATRGRLHDLYNYHGARTGRPTGEGPQPTNLPKAGPDVHRCGWHGRVPLPGGGCGRYFGGRRVACPWCGTARGPASGPVEWNPAAAEDALEVIGWRDLATLELFFGDAMLTIAGCLRGLFVASPGRTLVSSDFTAIEGVVIACLASEQWRIDAFREDRSLYVESAARAFRISIDDMLAHHKATGQHHPMRQIGKGMELGLGFGGWINALRQFDVDGTDDELKRYVLAWRDASPAIVEFWGGQFRRGSDGYRTPHLHGLEGMAVLALQEPGRRCPVHRLDGSYSGVSYCYSQSEDVLRCFVPSGGHITYHRPRLAPAEQSWRGLAISYEGYNTNPKQGAVGWVTMSLYSGKCAENVTQKVARDIQMHAIDAAERNGYPVVLHTYDEIVADVTDGTVEALEALMVDVPAWAHGWPIKAAGGWTGHRYRKG